MIGSFNYEKRITYLSYLLSKTGQFLTEEEIKDICLRASSFTIPDFNKLVKNAYFNYYQKDEDLCLNSNTDTEEIEENEENKPITSLTKKVKNCLKYLYTFF